MSENSHRASPQAFVAAATASGIIAQQVAGKAVRDALFLSSFHATSLPGVMAIAALLSLGAVLALSRVMARHSPRHVLPFVAAFSAAGLAGDWGLVFVSPRAAAVAVYLHVAVFSPVVLSTFWSLVNERFDPHTAKAAVARIATGGTVGGVLGGLGAWRASSWVSMPTTVLLLAGVNALILAGALALTRAPKGNRDTDDEARVSRMSAEPSSLREHLTGLGVLRQAPYLRNLALLVALGAATSSLLDYVFSAQITATYGRGPALLAFFSLFGLVVSVISMIFQLTLGRIAMEKLGIAVNIAVLPGITVLGGAVGLAVPGPLSMSVLRGAEMIQRNTLFRAAYELLYTPLDEARKRTTKALIDVGFDRLGTVTGSGLAVVVVAVSTHNQGILLGVAVALGLLTLPLARRLHVGYVGALEQRLRDADRKLAAPEAPPRPTQLGDEPFRDTLIQQIEAMRARGEDPGRAKATWAHRRELQKAVDTLLSGDTAQCRLALGDWRIEHVPLTGVAILLLAHPELHRDARLALRKVAEHTTGQLVDALLDPTLDFAVRRRVPAVLSVCTSQRAADGLLLGFADPRFEVRYACGRALTTLTARAPDVKVPERLVIDALLREIARATTEFEELEDDADEEPNPLVEVLARDRVSRSVENLFALLSLLLEREPVRLCLHALNEGDDHHRGTALEYLQTVLPPEVRDALLPLLTDVREIPSARPAADVLAELRAAMEKAKARAQRA